MATTFAVLAGSVMNVRLRQLLSARAREARNRRDQVAFLCASNRYVLEKGRCPAIRKLVAEGSRELSEVHDPRTRDLATLVHWMRIEQFAMVVYGVAAPVANRTGFSPIAERMNAMISDLTAARHLMRGMETVVASIAERHQASWNEIKLNAEGSLNPLRQGGRNRKKQ